MLSVKHPTKPETIDTKITESGLATMPKRYAAIPIIAAPTMPAAVPRTETAPLVPGSTL